MAGLTVICIQTHSLPTGDGKFTEYKAGLEYAIEDWQFAPNLFEVKKKEKSKKEKQEDKIDAN
jgi:hypothetical protein